MKNINKKIALSIIGLAAGLNACKAPFDQDPVPNPTPSNFTANFVFVNAIPDAPSLDFYINNLKIDASLPADSAQALSTVVPITSNGVFANTGIRAKATTGKIGGVLGGSDLIFRATNTSSNNFQANNGGYYTIIAVDTINRPIPLRTLNAGNFGDTTYYSSQAATFSGKNKKGHDTTVQINAAANNSVVSADLAKSFNGNVYPSFLRAIGTIPLGSSDPGGSRFLLLTDAIPASITAGKFAARFVNASPDAGAATVTVNGNSLAGQLTYPMLFPTFNPSVGSRSATVTFTNNYAAAGSYSVVVKAGGTTITKKVAFVDQGVYTIVLAGSLAKKTLAITVAKNK